MQDAVGAGKALVGREVALVTPNRCHSNLADTAIDGVVQYWRDRKFGLDLLHHARNLPTTTSLF